MSPDLVPNSLLRFFGRSVFFQTLAISNTSSYEKYLWLFQIPLAMKNTSGLSKYLWLWRILDVDFSYFLQLWTLQLFQIPPAMNDSSYFKYLWLWKIPPALDYLRIHFFLVESCLKGLVHSGSSCRSWTYAAATMRNLTWQVDYVYLTEDRLIVQYRLYRKRCP